MKNLIQTISLLLMVAMIGSGCMSYAVMKSSQSKIAYRRAVASGDAVAIKAVRMGDNGMAVGIDVSNLSALTEQPILQFGAAILDALILYGSYEGIQSLRDNNSDNSDKNSMTISGDRNDVNITTINGDDNDSNADRTSTSY